MTDHIDLAKKARDYREAAERAPEFLRVLGSDSDGMYLRFAEEQERRATELEAAISPAVPGL